ncbi:hypothetical protein AAG747_18020 [Rapidithrix thailandica]|uniref:Alkyl hydroperoxide reductase subunit C/ Thiol specific antioxidant domain-containing protein n=1 Tax=Rapidithrix thailandica TaxID=413964 RepID=A0AAW9S140_9BACT
MSTKTNFQVSNNYKEILKKLFLFLLFCFSVLAVFTTYAKIKQLENKLIATSSMLQQKKTEVEIIRYNLKNQLENEGIKLDSNLNLTHFKSKKTLNIKEVLHEKKLFFRISNKHCDICIKQELLNLKSLSDSTGIQNICIIATSYEERTLHFLLKEYQIPFPVYTLTEKQLSFLPLEQHFLPYIFIAETNLIMHSVFVPTKELPFLSKEYYLGIKKKLLKS